MLVRQLFMRSRAQTGYRALAHQFSSAEIQSMDLQQLVRSMQPSAPAGDNVFSRFDDSECNPAEPFIVFQSHRRAVFITPTQSGAISRKMIPLPSGKCKHVFALRESNSINIEWVLALLRSGLPSEKMKHEVKVSEKVDPELQPDRNINRVPVLDEHGSIEDRYYNIQRYVGPDWQTVLSSPHLSLNVLQELLGLLPDIAAQLIHIHSCGYRHGDVRLENMTVYKPEGRLKAKCIDFDLSKQLPTAGFFAKATSCGVCLSDWEHFLREIERIIESGLTIPPDAKMALLDYCASVRAMIQEKDYCSLTDAHVHRELLASLNGCSTARLHL
jgi:hypothetical protein